MAIQEDESIYSDEEVDEKKHQQLVDKVLSLNKAQQLKKASRTEPTLKISEFDLVKSVSGKKGSIYLDDLTKSLSKKKNVNIEHKQILNSIHSTLPKPLEKPTADRIQRTVAYEKARLELDRWEPIVTSNRVSTNLSFPLKTEKFKDKEDITSKWRLKTAFDIEFEKNNPQAVEEIHVDIEKEKFTLSKKEILKERQNAAKLRALQSYEEAKARRNKKIKSKRYHRVQRKSIIKQQLKEFELLQKTNPEEALKRLEEIEKVRAHERFSLRHKSTGKWAKNKQIRAKYDKESRQELAQQLALSKELTQKINDGTDSEDDFPLPEEVTTNSSDKDNLFHNLKVDDKVKNFVANYSKYWLNKNEEKIVTPNNIPATCEGSSTYIGETPVVNEDTEKSSKDEALMKSDNCEVISVQDTNDSKIKVNKKKKTKPVRKSTGTSDWDIEVMENDNIDAVFDQLEKKMGNKVEKKLKNLKGNLGTKPKKQKRPAVDKEEKSLLTLPIQKKRPKIDEPLSESLNRIDENEEEGNELTMLSSILQKKNTEIKKVNNDQNDIKIKVTHLNSEIPNHTTIIDEENKSSIEDYIAEAFEDCEKLQAEFDKEKLDEIEKHKPKDVNLNLPGWGSWGGTGIIPNKRKQRRFIIKAPKHIPRKDDNKGFLIINEDASSKVKKHMVNELPFPFRRVKDFEASIRAPIGQTFVPETVFRKFTKPSVHTKLGTIIEPMDKDVLLNKTNS
ncbi:hypothetical protein WA026_000341 [Henosepilachna vigintioctopunctata]|uniref:U3 small nucleolar RNA-associated protein 14 homolog A n=1 Tax=Henosepilachna vigintioctopunctata TaxID=420089 RepID=A0AAW1V7V2_9CUCU